MASSLSNLPAIASTCSTPMSAINGITGRWNLGCTRTTINVVTFFPVGKRLQSNVRLSSLYQRRRNGLVVRAEKCKCKDGENKKTEKSPSGIEFPGKIITDIEDALLFDMKKRHTSPFRNQWDMKEIGNEIKMRLDMPGVCKDDVKVSLMGERILIIENVLREEKMESWSPSSYDTRFLLPRNYKKVEINATWNNGQLSITVRRPEIDFMDFPEKVMAEFKDRLLNIHIPIPIPIPESKVASNVDIISITDLCVCK